MSVFFFVLVVLVVARLFGELAVRAKQLSFLGELGAGIILILVIGQFPEPLGSSFLAIRDGEAFAVITNLGILALMVMAGMEMKVGELFQTSKAGVLIALGGVLLPFCLGFGLGWLFIPESSYKFIQSFFIGTALSVTAIPVTTRILMELGQLNTKLGHIVIGAAVIDDVVGLILLSVLLGLISGGESPSAGYMGLLMLKVGLFFGVVIVFGKLAMPRVASRLWRVKPGEIEVDMVFTAALLFALGLGLLAEYIGLHFAIGAFLAGLFMEETAFGSEIFKKVKEMVAGITLGFLGPIFFASAGLHFSLASVTPAWYFVLLLIGAATAGKLLGCGGVARLLGFSGRESLTIGIAMNSRLMVELVIATIALEAGLFSHPTPVPLVVAAIFPGIVAMAFVTSLSTSISLRSLLGRVTQVETPPSP